MATSNPVVVARVISAPREEVFDVLARPGRHTEIDGSSMLTGKPRGPERLSLGDVFSMKMRQGRMDYRTDNEVIEFVDNQRIAWATSGVVKDRLTIGGQTWRFILSDGAEPGTTLVRHEYDWKAANTAFFLRLGRYPSRMQLGMAATLERLEKAAAAKE